MEEQTAHIILKTPSLNVKDVHLETVPLCLTIRDLKEQLSNSYFSNPTVERQKLIYGGKILLDESFLSEILAEVLC